MAITFDWYENPTPADKEDEKKTLHPRLRFNGTLDTENLRSDIQMRTSLSETDVTAVLDALSNVMGKALTDGRRVHLDGIGYFYPTLTCTETITPETKNKSSKIRLKGIKFRADRKLKSGLGSIRVKRLKLEDHSAAITNEEIDLRLNKYFQTHSFLRRADFQILCNQTKNTAIRHIKRLLDEGKLENAGTMRQPIYIAGKEKNTNEK